jgi:RHS repeat-associated protein
LSLAVILTISVFAGCADNWRGADYMDSLQPRYGFYQVSLYSWKMPDGQYHFVLIPEAKENQFFAKFRRTDKYIATVAELKNRLLALPPGSVVAWRAVIENYRYDAFGAPSIYNSSGTQISPSAYSNGFLFTGREYASSFGFYEYRARAYHPGLGRFMSEDPKGFDAGDYNLFRYCHNDPEDLTDPMGLDLVPVGDAGAVARFHEAYAAWSASPTIGPLLKSINDSGRVVPVILTHDAEGMGLDSIHGKLYYDPYHGGELKEGGYNSPGTRGAHEIPHVERWLRDPKGYDRDRRKTDKQSMPFHKATLSNPEEERAMKYEQRYAHERHEPARPRYEQYKSYPETRGVNSNVPATTNSQKDKPPRLPQLRKPE